MATIERFLKDTKNHQMQVDIDQGVHRSIRFKKPMSFTYHFRLVTWPGHLSISGDMGDFVFARLNDMFEFFRDDSMENRINLSYWSEKLTAHDKNSGHKQFSQELFQSVIRERFAEWSFESRHAKDEALKHLEDEWDGLLSATPDNALDAIRAAEDYTCLVTGNGFSEMWDYRLDDYTFHFVWCCRAIVWGIKQYDLTKAGRTQADHDRLILAGAA